MIDHYKVLGVNPNATKDELKSAYRTLAKKYHPDVPTGNEKLFTQINVSYKYLSEKEAPKAPKEWSVGKADVYYRLIQSGNTIVLPEKDLIRDTKIFVMMGAREFTVILRAGTKLPTTIRITNIGPQPFDLKIQ